MFFCFYENLHCNNRSWKIFSTLSIMFFNVPCFPFCCFFSTEVVFRNGFQRTTQAARTMQATMIMKMVETFNSWKNVWDSIILCRFNLDHWIWNKKSKWISHFFVFNNYSDRVMSCTYFFLYKTFQLHFYPDYFLHR